MRRPPFYSLIGCLAIAITAIGYSIYIVQAPFDTLSIAITDIAIVCILLGMTLLTVGYDIQNLQRIIPRIPTAARPAPEHAGPGPQLASSQRIRIPRPDDFPPVQRKFMVRADRGEEDSGESDWPSERLASREALKLHEAEERLARLRGAVHRAEHMRDKSTPKPESQASDSERNTLRSRARTARSLEARGHIRDVGSFHVSLVGKDEIVLSSTATGEEVKFPCLDPEALEAAWRAFARGEKVRPIIESGHIIRIDLE